MVAPRIDRSQVAISRRRALTGVAGLTFAIALEQGGVSNAAERNAEPRQEGFELSTIAQGVDQSDSASLGRMARQAVIEIFRNRDPTAIDRFFLESFVQHDPNLADGRSGLKAFAEEIASSPKSDVTIYRTLVDGDVVMLHSRYESWRDFPGPVIAFDLFRFAGGKIVEHWGGQELEAPPNPSGHTQVDGPTAVVDRDQTEENRALVRAFKQVVTVELRFDRFDEFIEGDNYTQHASKVGDGTARMKARVSEVAKPGSTPVLLPRRYVAEGNFVLAIVEARTEPPTVNYDLFRVDIGKIAEHWDVLSVIPPRDQWQNANGPF
jgi:predicted SnoaL-like aldol condensation-catalyzing enzyme